MTLPFPRMRPSARFLAGLLCALSVLPVGVASVKAQDAPAEMGRSGAMRAPLNIVPPVMQQALGAQPVSRPPNEKLAPRVVARQSKRAVRAVAVAPGSAGEIVQVGQLGALQDAPIGLEEGFGSNLWRGARLAFITGQMARLPERIEMAALRNAELTLYRSTTAAPVGTVDGTSWYGARLMRFLSLGDTGSVLQLEGLAGGAAQDAYAAQALVLANLGRGDAASACALPRPQRGAKGHADTLSFFMQLLVYCQLRIGEFEKAGLTLELNEKTLSEDRFFRELAFLMAAQAQPVFGTAEQAEAAKQAKQEVPLVVPSEVTPMQLALLQLAGQALALPLDKMPPYFAAALAKDYAQPTSLQLGAALMAVRAGTLTPEFFSQMSQLADLSAFQDVPVAASGAAILSETAPAAVFLADALLKVDMAGPEDQATALADALRSAHDRGVWSDMVILLGDRLQDLAVNLSAANPSETGAPLADGPASVASATAFTGGNTELPEGQNAPIVSAADRAVLIPAFLALTETGNLPEVLLETETPTSNAAPSNEPIIGSRPAISTLMARLTGYAEINNPAQDPLGDLLAALPDETILPGAASGTVYSEPNAAPAFSETQTGSALEALPLAEETLLPADTRRHPIADWAAFEAQYERASAAQQKYLTRELAVYQGLGFEMPDAFKTPPSADEAANIRFEKLADSQWVGDLLLALVTRHAGSSAVALSESELMSLLALLRRAGLNETAHAMGAEILWHAAAELSLVAPQSFFAEPR